MKLPRIFPQFPAGQRGADVEPPRRILIVRMSALGDAIHGLPVACALRDAFPRAEIGWVVEGRHGDVLVEHPAIDHLIRVPRRWLKSPSAVLGLRRHLRALRFDAAIDLQCLAKSGVASWLSGAPRRIGFAGLDSREWSGTFRTTAVMPAATHVVDKYLELLRPLGIERPQVRFDVPAWSDAATEADHKIKQCGCPESGFAILNAGAGWPSKLWPAERYGRLAQRLAAEHGLASLAVWGGRSELPLAEQIVAHSAGAARLAPSTSIAELAAVCRRAALFVGSDTGPLHLAVAVGTPAISLHGASRAEVCGAYGPQNIRLQVRYEDGPARHRRGASNAAMCEITVDAVVAACGKLLARSSPRRIA